MNWLLILVLAFIVGNVIWGYKKGFMKVALSLVSWIIVLVACNVATPVVAEGVLTYTPLQSIVHETVNEKLNDAIDEALGGVSGSLSTEQIEAINEQIPEQLRTILYGYGQSLEDLITSAGDIEVDTAALAGGAAHLIALLIVLVVTKIGLLLLERILDLVAKLPLIGQLNAILGIAAGGLNGLIWSWVLLTVVAVLAYTGANTELMLMVDESSILTWLYGINPILAVIVQFL